jgi:predicted alpha/beta-fold hydrolase
MCEIIQKHSTWLPGMYLVFSFDSKYMHFRVHTICIDSIWKVFFLLYFKSIEIKFNFFNEKREILNLPDDGQLALDWENAKSATRKLIVLILPGLTSSSNAGYITHYVKESKKKGCVAVVMNFRGLFLSTLKKNFIYE